MALKISKLLKGFRGKPKGDIEAIVQAIMKLGKFAEKNTSRLIEADINPLIVRTKGKGVHCFRCLDTLFRRYKINMSDPIKVKKKGQS
jgi:acetyl-CoA synthetase